MTHRECVSRRTARTRRLPIEHPDALALQIAQVRRLSEGAWATLSDKLRAIEAMQHESVEIEPLLSRWIQHARLSTRTLIPLFRQAWEFEGGRPTAYDAVNALSRVATHEPSLTDRQRRVLAGLAGLLAFRHKHLCPRCFSLLGGPLSADTHRPAAERDEEEPGDLRRAPALP
jgi:hypothetical protein